MYICIIIKQQHKLSALRAALPYSVVIVAHSLGWAEPWEKIFLSFPFVRVFRCWIRKFSLLCLWLYSAGSMCLLLLFPSEVLGLFTLNSQRSFPGERFCSFPCVMKGFRWGVSENVLDDAEKLNWESAEADVDALDNCSEWCDFQIETYFLCVFSSYYSFLSFLAFQG